MESHPLYKTRQCLHYQKGFCMHGGPINNSCGFYHDPSERRFVYCRYGSLCFNRANCIFTHPDDHCYMQCKYGSLCQNDLCTFSHPAKLTIGDFMDWEGLHDDPMEIDSPEMVETSPVSFESSEIRFGRPDTPDFVRTSSPISEVSVVSSPHPVYDSPIPDDVSVVSSHPVHDSPVPDDVSVVSDIYSDSSVASIEAYPTASDTSSPPSHAPTWAEMCSAPAKVIAPIPVRPVEAAPAKVAESWADMCDEVPAKVNVPVDKWREFRSLCASIGVTVNL